MQSEPKFRPQNQRITISPNTKCTYGKPNEQVATQPPNLAKYNLDTFMVNIVEKLTPKQSNTEHEIGGTALERSVTQNILLAGLNRLNGYPTSSSACAVIQSYTFINIKLKKIVEDIKYILQTLNMYNGKHGE